MQFRDPELADKLPGQDLGGEGRCNFASLPSTRPKSSDRPAIFLNLLGALSRVLLERLLSGLSQGREVIKVSSNKKSSLKILTSVLYYILVVILDTSLFLFCNSNKRMEQYCCQGV